ncbi:MAG TPA: three-Cys-motif partner protein TcmP [Stellaceae bacterium]|nr:three-Cys-motif partner protein TcmP [Stellaceae bacterium]
MPTSQHLFGGAWTVKKLEALKAYLNGYAHALKNQPFNRIYIDAFAGTGDRAAKRRETATLMEIPELDEITKGSARIALEIDPPFYRYIYVEKRQNRSKTLEDLKREFPDRQIEVLTGDANKAVQRICRETDWRKNRAVLFLDPYGMQVSWETLEAVAATKAIDVWMLYPTGMGLNRLLTKDGEIPAEWQQTLDRSLGTTDWQQAFYRVREQNDLFGEPKMELVKDAGTEKFESYLLDRLRRIFVAVAPQTLPLVNSKGQVMYLLCFACGNERGAEIAVRIARSVIKKRRR